MSLKFSMNMKYLRSYVGKISSSKIRKSSKRKRMNILEVKKCECPTEHIRHIFNSFVHLAILFFPSNSNDVMSKK